MNYALPAFGIFCLLFALREAVRDDRDIENNRPIHHVTRWLFRAAICAVPVLGLSLLWNDYWKALCGLSGVAFGVFTPAFRLFLNSVRGLPWHYMSNTGNAYDRTWTCIAWVLSGRGRSPKPKHFGCVMRERTLRAGLAYGFEIIVLIAAITYILVTYNSVSP